MFAARCSPVKLRPVAQTVLLLVVSQLQVLERLDVGDVLEGPAVLLYDVRRQRLDVLLRQSHTAQLVPSVTRLNWCHLSHGSAGVICHTAQLVPSVTRLNWCHLSHGSAGVICHTAQLVSSVTLLNWCHLSHGSTGVICHTAQLVSATRLNWCHLSHGSAGVCHMAQLVTSATRLNWCHLSHGSAGVCQDTAQLVQQVSEPNVHLQMKEHTISKYAP